jgi:hypothetical protein
VYLGAASALGGSCNASTGMTVSASKPAMHAKVICQSVRANTFNSNPPPRIMPKRYAPT